MLSFATANADTLSPHTYSAHSYPADDSAADAHTPYTTADRRVRAPERLRREPMVQGLRIRSVVQKPGSARELPRALLHACLRAVSSRSAASSDSVVRDIPRKNNADQGMSASHCTPPVRLSTSEGLRSNTSAAAR